MSKIEAKHRPQPHVVIVDDDVIVRETLRDCLEAEGFRVSEAQGGAALFDVLAREQADLVLLDLRLGDESGLEIARGLAETSDVAIIMVTAKDDPLDRVIGLEMGADDYITKPFHVREVLARVRSVLRRRRVIAITDQEEPCSETWYFEGYALDTKHRKLIIPDGTELTLTTSEFTLLTILLRHANQPLSRDQLMDLLGGENWMANDRVIDNRILRLRKKLSTPEVGADLIQSVRGFGYVFAAEVRRE